MATYEEWIEGGRDYEAGLALLSSCSRNRVLLQNLSRKHNPEKLNYELKKLNPKAAKIVIKIKSDVPSVNSKHLVSSSIHSSVELPAPARTKIIREGRAVKVEDLPIRLQNLYRENTDKYKLMRALHEKAKLAKTVAEREPLTRTLSEYDEQIRKNWMVIDSWDGKPDVPVVTNPIDHKRINSNRKYISDNRRKLLTMEDGPTRSKVLAEMQKRVNELMGAGESIGKKIGDDLKKLGLTL